MPNQIDLEPEDYSTPERPHRLVPPRTAALFLIPDALLIALTGYGAASIDAWYATFLPWAPLVLAGAIIGYVWPAFFFDKNG